MGGPKPSGFVAESIQLLECDFRASPDVSRGVMQSLIPPDFEFRFQSSINRREKLITAVGEVIGSNPEGAKAVLTLRVKMRVTFSWRGETSMEVKDFARRNAVAFLWPYLREVIWNLSVRTDLPALVLPVLNLQLADVEVVEVGAAAMKGPAGSAKSSSEPKRF